MTRSTGAREQTPDPTRGAETALRSVIARMADMTADDYDDEPVVAPVFHAHSSLGRSFVAVLRDALLVAADVPTVAAVLDCHTESFNGFDLLLHGFDGCHAHSLLRRATSPFESKGLACCLPE
jgi:hypothetical protein